jgi:hypothetical protein
VNYRLFQNRICKVCALVTATSLLPLLAHAQTATAINPPSPVPVKRIAVPDRGPGIALLIAAFGAILVFSGRLSPFKSKSGDGKVAYAPHSELDQLTHGKLDDIIKMRRFARNKPRTDTSSRYR